MQQPSDYQTHVGAVVPRKAAIMIETDEYPEGYRLEIPRLTMKATLRLSQLLDQLNHDPQVKEQLDNLIRTMTTAADGEGPGNATLFTINSVLATLNIDQVYELFSIITKKDHDWLDRNLEPGWAIEALKVAFQQQGFRRLFESASNVGDVQAEMGKLEKVADSVPQSISYNQPTVGTTIPS